MLRNYPPTLMTLQGGIIPARAVILILCTYGKETLTNNYNFFTNKNENNETEEKKENAIFSFLTCIKK